MGNTNAADAVAMLKQAAERLRSKGGMPVVDPRHIANFLDDTAEGLPPWGAEDSSQEFALRIAHAVVAERTP